MPCFFPLQATFSLRDDGKKELDFRDSGYLSSCFSVGSLPKSLDVDDKFQDVITLPCGRCMGCRLERSRQWAVRQVHEAKCWSSNCFVTLTFDEEHLATLCPDGSLVRKHVQDFMKRLRKRFSGFDEYVDGDGVSSFPIRVFYCGEYGSALSRPHYHLCLFNFDFKDKTVFSHCGSYYTFISRSLSELWPYGHSMLTDFTFDTAAYVARYVTKKVTGDMAKGHYKGKLPEFCGMSLNPGIGSIWLDKFGESDVFPHDSVIINARECKPPRFYDKRLEAEDPSAFEATKLRRVERAQKKAAHSTYDRLAVRLKCLQARMNKFSRKLEK